MSQTILTDMVFKSRRTILEILERQNYNINDYTGFSIHEIHSMLQTKQLDLLINKNDDSSKCYIKYHLGKTLRPSNIQEYIEDLFYLEKLLNKNDDLIIISKDEPNETLNKYLTDLWENEQIYVRIISIKRLQYNILNHSLVPEHTILKNKEEINNMIKQYNLNINKLDKQIPDISRFSPVALMIGIRPGEICKIMRDSKTAVNSLFYRICI